MYRVFILFIVWVFIITADAQDTVMPRGEDIFTSAVEIVDTLTILAADKNGVRVYDPQAQSWLNYPYPDSSSLGSFFYDTEYYATSAREYTFYTCSGHSPGYPAIFCVFIFNLETGEFILPDGICGSFFGGGGWVDYGNNAGSAFCNLATGELSAPLPAGFRFVDEMYVRFTSPMDPKTIGYPTPLDDYESF